MPEKAVSYSAWHSEVGFLPSLVDRLAFDLAREGRAQANAVAEAVKTLDGIARSGRTQHGGRVSFGARAALRDAVNDFAALDGGLSEAADSMVKASTPEPVGPKPLWKQKGLHLPYYIEHIANDLREKRGMTESQAIATAIAAVKRWARGGGKVDPGTRAAAAKALAEWNALKARYGGGKKK